MSTRCGVRKRLLRLFSEHRWGTGGISEKLAKLVSDEGYYFLSWTSKRDSPEWHEAIIWAVRNVNHPHRDHNHNGFWFSFEYDAIAFKLAFGKYLK